MNMPARIPLGGRALGLRLADLALAVRGLLFLGRRYTCPCCGWRVRAFVVGGLSLQTKDLGSCPRCNAKARHRRIWVFLERRTDVISEPLRLLHVSPKYALWRRLARRPALSYVATDLEPRAHVDVLMDLRRVPFRAAAFDAAICVHVLEEIADDGAAMRELHRVLGAPGWALITVPTRLDRPTYEDPSITDPADRKREFGEDAHVRVYGHDLVSRLEGAGFKVEVDLAEDVDEVTRTRYGLRTDENIFFCVKD